MTWIRPHRFASRAGGWLRSPGMSRAESEAASLLAQFEAISEKSAEPMEPDEMDKLIG